MLHFEIDTIKQHADKPHLLSLHVQTTVNLVCCQQARSKTGRLVQGKRVPAIFWGWTLRSGLRILVGSVPNCRGHVDVIVYPSVVALRQRQDDKKLCHTTWLVDLQQIIDSS
jgi:hypothetical protein